MVTRVRRSVMLRVIMGLCRMPSKTTPAFPTKCLLSRKSLWAAAPGLLVGVKGARLLTE